MRSSCRRPAPRDLGAPAGAVGGTGCGEREVAVAQGRQRLLHLEAHVARRELLEHRPDRLWRAAVLVSPVARALLDRVREGA